METHKQTMSKPLETNAIIGNPLEDGYTLEIIGNAMGIHWKPNGIYWGSIRNQWKSIGNTMGIYWK